MRLLAASAAWWVFVLACLRKLTDEEAVNQNRIGKPVKILIGVTAGIIGLAVTVAVFAPADSSAATNAGSAATQLNGVLGAVGATAASTAQANILPADQRLAERITLRFKDFDSGWRVKSPCRAPSG